MPETPKEQQSRFPLAAYHYRVRVGEAPLRFSEVSGLSVEYEQVTYRHGWSFWEGAVMQTVPDFEKLTTVTCKRGTVLDADLLYLHAWLTSRDSRSVEVQLLDASSAPVVAWKIRAAIPTRLSAPAFSAATNDAAIDTLELQVKGVSFVEL